MRALATGIKRPRKQAGCRGRTARCLALQLRGNCRIAAVRSTATAQATRSRPLAEVSWPSPGRVLLELAAPLPPAPAATIRVLPRRRRAAVEAVPSVATSRKSAGRTCVASRCARRTARLRFRVCADVACSQAVGAPLCSPPCSESAPTSNSESAPTSPVGPGAPAGRPAR